MIPKKITKFLNQDILSALPVKRSLSLKEENHEESGKTKILEFIENNATKSEFITWLNLHTTDKKLAFSENEDWQEITEKIIHTNKVPHSLLKEYAQTLANNEDIKTVLKEIENKAEKATESINKAYLFTNLQKFASAIGGISIFLSLAFFLIAVSLNLEVLNVSLATELRLFFSSTLAITGVVNMLAGILLISR